MRYDLDLLAELSDEGCQYNTIGLHRSALLTFHDSIQGIKIKVTIQQSMFLCLDCLIKDPPQPKYIFIWDADVLVWVNDDVYVYILFILFCTNKHNQNATRFGNKLLNETS